MIESIKEFYANNSTMCIIAVIAFVAILGICVFLKINSDSRPNNSISCDMASGMCHSSDNMSSEQENMMQQQMMQQQGQQDKMSPEQEQMMKQQQMMHQQEMMHQQDKNEVQ